MPEPRRGLVGALQWLWAAGLGLVLVAAGVLLTFGGVLGFVTVVTRGDLGVTEKVLSGLVGVAVAAVGLLFLTFRNRIVVLLSGREPFGSRDASFGGRSGDGFWSGGSLGGYGGGGYGGGGYGGEGGCGGGGGGDGGGGGGDGGTC